MAEFRMPSLGADMDEGTLLEWLVAPGAEVHRGDIVAVVDTSKAAVEVETFADGVIDRILVKPGEKVPVGTVLATITAAAATARPPVAAAPVAAAPAAGPPEPGPPVTSPLVRRLATDRHVDPHTLHGSGPGGRITHADVERAAAAPPAPAGGPAAPVRPRVSPFARRLAAELGVDLSAVAGTGPGHTISADDVRHTAAAAAPAAPAVAAPPPAAAAPAVTATPPDGGDRTAAMRATIAALMTRSKREIPHYYLSEAVDLSAAVAWLRDRNRDLPVPKRLVPAALLLKAAALGLRTVPQLNGFWIDDRFVPGAGIHLGVAVSLRGGGLVAPAIHDAADLGVAELMARMRDLVTRTRAGRLRRAEMADPTVTVSNMGEQGAESILGVIYPPQVALIGFGRVVDRPWAVDGLLGVRPVVTVTLAADHRATDGATGARYLHAVARLLHRPEEL
jgi:pyruvate dehydrogenase E2 component (dihydrolipoamide acetyltransferase)